MRFKLSDICQYAKGKIDVSSLNNMTYISTENMLPNKGGITEASSMPTTSQTQSFMAGDVLVSNIRPYFKKIWFADFDGGCSNDVLVFRAKDGVSKKFLHYVLADDEFFNYSMATSKGTKMPRGDKAALMQYRVPDFSFEIQEKIASILASIDDKITLNNRINKNLEEQAFAVFSDMFADSIYGEKTVGDVITPNRGKGLLSKDAVPGDVPVVAGGLDPATYHNQSNTIAPVLTISASGANAGYVNLWNVPVWSSDSSFIDSAMTKDVYFWYVMLKSRQSEIFDAQTGSAQPHIYPKHIAGLSMGSISPEEIRQYTALVSPLFEAIGANKKENISLATIRDTLLPKLMSGEIDVSDIEL